MGNEKLDFLKHIITKVIKEPIKLGMEFLRQFLYPKAWFYAIFGVFIMKLFLLRDKYKKWDTVLIIALIILIIWKEYKEWYDEYKYEQRKKLRERVVKEQMKGR